MVMIRNSALVCSEDRWKLKAPLALVVTGEVTVANSDRYGNAVSCSTSPSPALPKPVTVPLSAKECLYGIGASDFGIWNLTLRDFEPKTRSLPTRAFPLEAELKATTL